MKSLKTIINNKDIFNYIEISYSDGWKLFMTPATMYGSVPCYSKGYHIHNSYMIVDYEDVGQLFHHSLDITVIEEQIQRCHP